ncbi:MAG: glycosyltransferase family 9 protein, partial [Planctomycetes bacterium]|nr:glycosyltransferase family 9 protein [Planctomycetota bacterium]
PGAQGTTFRRRHRYPGIVQRRVRRLAERRADPYRFSRGEGRELAPYLDNWLIRPNGVHAVDITLALLQGLGERLDRWDLQPEFIFPPCSEEDHRRIGVALEEMDLPASYAVMGPWGSFTSKLWPVERFVELAARLEQKLGMPSLILGHGIRERGAVAGLLAKREGLRSRIAPELTLPGVVELARGARLFVGSDSFPMHAAAAAGTPTIGLFGITDPQRLGPYGKNGRAVYAAITLVKSTRERRRLGQENMLALTVDQVEEEVFNLLEPKPYL